MGKGKAGIEGFERVWGLCLCARGGDYPIYMLMASIFGLAFILLLGLSMHIPTKAMIGHSPLPPLSTNLLVGLSTFICTLWVTFLFNLTIHKSLFVWVVVLALINLGSILYLKVQQGSEPVAYKSGVRGFLIVSTASALSIFPQTGLSISANLRSRIGPDMIGWVSSGKYLYNHSNLDDLKNSIRVGLNISDISQIFEESQKLLKNHVYNLLSFTDQVNAEFLIGAKRIIGPRIFSAAMVALGEYRLPIAVTTVTFIFTAIGLVFVIDNLGDFKKFALKELPAIVLFFLIACNFAFQNPLNEGGIGQVFVFPSLCLLISSYLRNVFVLESIVLFLLSIEKLLYQSVVIKFGNFSHTNTLALLGNLNWPERGANIVQPSKNLQRLLIVEAEYCEPYKSAKEILLMTKELCFLDAASPSIKLNP
jgi:hypothetical protein